MKLQQASEYFRQPGFRRLMDLMTRKYQALGRVGGSVKIAALTTAEKEALSSFFRRDFSKQKSATIGLEDFEKALQKTRFSGIKLKQLLDGYAGEDVLTRAEMERSYEVEKERFWKDLSERHNHQNCQMWLEHIQNKGSATRGIHQAYDRDAGRLGTHMDMVLKALAQLPVGIDGAVTRYERLPFFASRITSDPHGFDLDREQGRFLLSALQYLRSQQDAQYTIQSVLNSEQKTELFGYFGVIRDDLLNFVTCTGILGFNGKHEMPSLFWKDACAEQVVLNVPLREIIKMERFTTAHSFFKCGKEKVVFVVENAGVYSEVLDHIGFLENLPLICTHGQIKLAALILLDKLVEEGVTIFYSGDFDPEGLTIAQRLLLRYGNCLKLWHYGPNDYYEALSKVKLSDTRLNLLHNVSALEFAQVKAEMIKQKKVAYQENLLKNLVGDIKEYMISGKLDLSLKG